MNTILIYGIIFVILIALELVYFKIADTFNIIDKPNERSSHSTIVLRGGGIIFLFSLWIWSVCIFDTSSAIPELPGSGTCGYEDEKTGSSTHRYRIEE